MQQNGSKFFAIRYTFGPRGVEKRSTHFFSRSHIAEQIKRMEHRESFKQAHILSIHTHPCVGSKSQNIFFLKVVMFHVKLKAMEQRAPCKHIFCPYTHPRCLWLGQKVTTK